MKNYVKFLSLIALVTVGFSYQQPTESEELKHHEILENESFTFGKNNLNVKKFYPASFKRWSYDDSQYDIKIDKKGKITLSSLFGCKEKHQNELDIFLAGGSVSRKNDTIIVNIKSNEKNLYVIKLEKAKAPDEFSSEVQLKFVSKTLKNSYCPSLISTSSHNFEAIALPSKIGTDDIHKKNHKNDAVGVFSFLSVTDARGKTMKFTEGDYVIIGGNSLTQKP